MLYGAWGFSGGLISGRLHQTVAEAIATKILKVHQLQLVDSNDQIWALPYFTREGQPAISLIDQKMQKQGYARSQPNRSVRAWPSGNWNDKFILRCH